MACAPSEDSDQPGHPPSLIRVFAVRLKKAMILSAQRRLWSDWADAQADLSLRWAHNHIVVFSRGGSICFLMFFFHPEVVHWKPSSIPAFKMFLYRVCIGVILSKHFVVLHQYFRRFMYKESASIGVPLYLLHTDGDRSLMPLHRCSVVPPPHRWRQVTNAPIGKIKLTEIRMLEFCQSWTL